MLNPEEYNLVYDANGIKLFQPASGDYHMSRYVAAGAQNIYSASGATKEYLEALTQAVIKQCEDVRSNIRTDVAVLMNNLRYRLKFPVDEDCAIRMGAIYTFMENENPEIVDAFQTEEKVKLAHRHPDLYAFFLTLGIEYTPIWKDIDRNLLTTQYFLNRRQELEKLTPLSMLVQK